MARNRTQPITTVNRSTYQAERPFAMLPHEIVEGSEYKMRLLSPQFTDEQYADDFLVRLERLTEAAGGILLKHLQTEHYEATVQPLNAESSPVSAPYMIRLVPDGGVHELKPFRFTTLNRENGYLVSAIDENDIPAGLEIARPLVPSV